MEASGYSPGAFFIALHAYTIAVAQTVLTATQLENSLGAIYMHSAV